jgi:integrase
MATIWKRGASWQVQVRRQGYPPLARTFTSHADATAWARDTERAIDRAELPVPRRDLRALTVSDLLDRYEDEVTVKKRGADRERFKLRVLRSHKIATAPVDKVSGAMVARYRDDRLKIVSGATVRRELAVLQHCFEVARREWDIPLKTNPVRQIRLPDPSRPRQHRLTLKDTSAFWQAVDRARAQWVKPFIILSIETGMRRGELLSLKWRDVDLCARLVRLAVTKNGHERPRTDRHADTRCDRDPLRPPLS